MRFFERSEQRFRLVRALLIRALRGGIRNNAAAGLHVGYAVLDHHSTKRDAGIKVAREIEVENAAGINSTAGAVHLFDDFHWADLLRAGDRARRETKHQRVQTIHGLSEAASQAWNQ